MMFIYKTAKLAPVWTIILEIQAIFVHQTITEHTYSLGKTGYSEEAVLKQENVSLLTNIFSLKKFHYKTIFSCFEKSEK